MSSLFAVPGIVTLSLAVDMLWACALIGGFIIGRLETPPVSHSGTWIVLGTTLFLTLFELARLHTGTSLVQSNMMLVAAAFALAHEIGLLTSHKVPTAP